MNREYVDGSFRDPSGHVFYKGNDIFRSVNNSYKDNYDLLINTGLFQNLIEKKYIVKHEETDFDKHNEDKIYQIIKPELIPFISYPYEWSFSQLKDAAILTLNIQLVALEHSMILKDASAYNIQFKDDKPIFIDTLSFEKYEDGKPWQAYQQFCQHFLSPLCLMSYTDIRLSQLLKLYIDGIPLDLTSKLLPFKSFFSFGILSHLHLHAYFQNYYSNKKKDTNNIKQVNKKDIINICENLKNLIINLKWSPKGTEWFNYYTDNNNYEDETMTFKKEFVLNNTKKISPNLVWDLGSNTGKFSRISSELGFRTISFDIDPACVELNYLQMKRKSEKNLLPLQLDLTNPSPSIGWANNERSEIYKRNRPDLLLSLALIHHLVITYNIPMSKISELFSNLSANLIIEFVPKSDTQVKKLLTTKKNKFEEYNQENFERIFKKNFEILSVKKVLKSERVIYYMRRFEKI